MKAKDFGEFAALMESDLLGDAMKSWRPAPAFDDLEGTFTEHGTLVTAGTSYKSTAAPTVPDWVRDIIYNSQYKDDDWHIWCDYDYEFSHLCYRVVIIVHYKEWVSKMRVTIKDDEITPVLLEENIMSSVEKALHSFKVNGHYSHGE